MSASNLELVNHIVIETAFILQHTQNKNKEQVIDDEVLCRAVCMSSKKVDSLVVESFVV